jgi:hypothetical protein
MGGSAPAVLIPRRIAKAISIRCAIFLVAARLGFRWIDAMQVAMPELSIHAELGADRPDHPLSWSKVSCKAAYFTL